MTQFVTDQGPTQKIITPDSVVPALTSTSRRIIIVNAPQQNQSLPVIYSANDSQLDQPQSIVVLSDRTENPQHGLKTSVIKSLKLTENTL